MAGNKNSGRRAIPLRVLELEGKKPRRPEKRYKPDTSKPPPKFPTPKDLSSEQLSLWEMVTQQRRNWLSTEDLPLLTTMIVDYGLMQYALTEVKDDPLNARKRTAYLSYRKAFVDCAARFGLTPCDRAKFLEPDESKTEEAKKAAKYLA